MIHSSRQLKALVRNKSLGDSTKAQLLIRTYIMERFLERLSLSDYKDHLVLKGGLLVASLVGLSERSTMDIDASIRNLNLSEADVQKMVEEICAITLDDGITFEIKSLSSIMDEADYPGIRVKLEAKLEKMITSLKLDFSTGDVLTPAAIGYAFPLLFEERTLSLFTYNLETMLAEKLETIFSRGTQNTRMRDFYDIYILAQTFSGKIDFHLLSQALESTSRKRQSQAVLADKEQTLKEISSNTSLMTLWQNYQRNYDYASDLTWNTVILSLQNLVEQLEN